MKTQFLSITSEEIFHEKRRKNALIDFPPT